MARTTGKVNPPKGQSGSIRERSMSPEARQHMIGEAAYYRYVRRGYAPGHDVEDWLAAEADFERESVKRTPSDPPEALEALDEEFGMQQSGAIGPAEDEALKRALKQHPRRDIPRIESIEPEDAPLKE